MPAALLLRLPAPNLDPDVVATASGDDRKTILALLRHLVLDGAELLELRLRLRRQQLRQHPGHRIEVQSVRRDGDGLRAHDYVRPLADVHDEGVAIGADNRGHQ